MSRPNTVRYAAARKRSSCSCGGTAEIGTPITWDYKARRVVGCACCDQSGRKQFNCRRLDATKESSCRCGRWVEKGTRILWSDARRVVIGCADCQFTGLSVGFDVDWAYGGCAA